MMSFYKFILYFFEWSGHDIMEHGTFAHNDITNLNKYAMTCKHNNLLLTHKLLRFWRSVRAAQILDSLF